MQNKLILLTSLAIIWMSCSRSNINSGPNPPKPPVDTNHYYIKATIDGTETNFLFGLQAMTSGNTVPGELSFSGNQADSNHTQAFIFEIRCTAGIRATVGPGTYTDQDTTKFTIRGIYYADAAGPQNLYIAGKSPDEHRSIVSSVTNPLKLTITAIGDTTIKGSFSGDFFWQIDAYTMDPTRKRTITNGEFFLKTPH